MSDGFSSMVKTARTFLGDLSQNNDRDWFEAHKATFKKDIEAPLKLLTDLFAEDLSRLTGKGHTGKVGRIYRDVRFSKDKSPYNTHVHAYWMQAGEVGPGWLLHIDAEGAKLMTGLHALNPDGLAQYRAAVDRDGDALQTAIEEAQASGAELIDFGDSVLKRVPKPYEQGHPHADLLRRKQIALGARLEADRAPDGLMPAMVLRIQTVLPFWRWCQSALT
jgi:uncharacterized protein (TIGR02453 family)